MDRLLEDRMLPIVKFATLMGFMAVYDWAVVWLHYKPHPYFSTSLFLFGAGYAGYKYVAFKRTIERLRGCDQAGTVSGLSGNSWRTCWQMGRGCFTTWSVMT